MKELSFPQSDESQKIGFGNAFRILFSSLSTPSYISFLLFDENKIKSDLTTLIEFSESENDRRAEFFLSNQARIKDEIEYLGKLRVRILNNIEDLDNSTHPDFLKDKIRNYKSEKRTLKKLVINKYFSLKGFFDAIETYNRRASLICYEEKSFKSRIISYLAITALFFITLQGVRTLGFILSGERTASSFRIWMNALNLVEGLSLIFFSFVSFKDKRRIIFPGVLALSYSCIYIISNKYPSLMVFPANMLYLNEKGVSFYFEHFLISSSFLGIKDLLSSFLFSSSFITLFKGKTENA